MSGALDDTPPLRQHQAAGVAPSAMRSYRARAAGDSYAALRVTSTSVRDTSGSTSSTVRIMGYALF